MNLPEGFDEWIAEVVGGRVLSADRIPGGASREGWFIDVEVEDATVPLYLRLDRRGTPKKSAFHTLWCEAEVFAALHGTGVTVPRILAVHPTLEAFVAERISGETWFYRIRDPEEQIAVARDFIRNLAALHRVEPATLDIPCLGELRPVPELVAAELEAMRERATGDDGTIDPLVELSIDWLAAHIPEYEGPAVLVQGDTGPGNFLYENGRVTAVLDWELAHWGDPMDDIAWLSLRTVQDTFTHFPDRLAEYEELSGHTIDPGRVWYYRLFAETRLSSSSRGAARDSDAAATAPRDPGNPLIYGMLHRRLTLEALAEVAGVVPPDDPIPPDGVARAHHHVYDDCLNALSAIVPRMEDPLASQWSKGIARALKYLKEIDRNAASYDDAELDEMAALLGERPPSVPEARRALADAVRSGRVSQDDYIAQLWRQMARDDHLMREASGALRTRTWPPLSDR